MTYYIRLDDACEHMNVKNWERIEELLNRFSIKPLVGVIPHCEDNDLLKLPKVNNFWELIDKWNNNGWVVALHGFNHVYSTDSGGLNPINKRSEFAAISLDEQKQKIKEGLSIFKEHNVYPKVFFAPSHTFDKNTLQALKEESDIRIISDTIANKRYYKYGFTFIPQQSGKVRKLKFKEVTFCYHPNEMKDEDFVNLEKFIGENRDVFSDFSLNETKRKASLYDWLLNKSYFLRRKIKKN